MRDKVSITVIILMMVLVLPVHKAEAKEPDYESEIAEASKSGGNSIAELESKYLKQSENDYSHASNKLRVSVIQFYSFYLTNSRTRYELCQRVGVDITPYLTKFKYINQRELSSARKWLFFATKQTENQYYKDNRVLFEHIISTTNKYQEKDLNLSEVGYCRAVVERSSSYAENMAFADLAPLQSKLLIDLEAGR